MMCDQPGRCERNRYAVSSFHQRACWNLPYDTSGYAGSPSTIRLVNVPSRSTVTVTVSPAVSGGWASRPRRPHSSARHPPPQVPEPNTSPGLTQVPREAYAIISPQEKAIEAKVSWPISVPLTDAVIDRSNDLAARADSSSSGVTSTGPSVVAVSLALTAPKGSWISVN